jgi:hypothetical protein
MSNPDHRRQCRVCVQKKIKNTGKEKRSGEEHRAESETQPNRKYIIIEIKITWIIE